MKGRDMMSVLTWVRTSAGSCPELCYYNFGLTCELENVESIKSLYHPASITVSNDFPAYKRHGITHEMTQAYASSATAWLLSKASIDFPEPDTFWETSWQFKAVKNPVPSIPCCLVTPPVLRYTSKEWTHTAFFFKFLFKVEIFYVKMSYWTFPCKNLKAYDSLDWH